MGVKLRPISTFNNKAECIYQQLFAFAIIRVA